MLLGSVAALAACGGPSKIRTYRGPEVTAVVLYKQTRTMVLMHNERRLAAYNIELGFAPNGHKQREGDGRTPEGQYWIDRRNPNSRYHLSIGISYPNSTDRARARAAGVRPGGDIFIHGTPNLYLGVDDWTAGCIAVTNREMEDIYAMVKDGTPIWIVADPSSALEPAEEPVEVIGVTNEDPQSEIGTATTLVEEPVAVETLPAAPSPNATVAPVTQSAPVQTGAALRPRSRPNA